MTFRHDRRDGRGALVTSLLACAGLAGGSLLLGVPGLAAAQAPPAATTVRQASRVDVSPPLWSLSGTLTAGAPQAVPLGRPDLQLRAISPAPEQPSAEPHGPVPGFRPPTPTPIANFEGISDDDQVGLGLSRAVPSDANGDVGPSHYVQAVNRAIAVYDKTGVLQPGFPKANNALFFGFGGPCEASNDGDPIVLYDQLADRWVFSQFVRAGGIQCLAVSQTGDPTGSYFRYAFEVDNGINDFAKLGVWSDAYYMTFNSFSPGEAFLNVGTVAFERDKMLQGLPAQVAIIPVPAPAGPGCAGAGDCFFSLQPAHLEGLRPPPVGAPNPLVMAFDEEVFGGAPDPAHDAYKLWRFSVNWANPSLSTLTGPLTIQTLGFDAELCGFAEDCIPQPGVSQGLDALSQFTAYRLGYRNLGDHEALTVAHTVDVDPPAGSHAGIRWAEIRDPAGSPTLFQTGQYAPDADHRWVPSVAMDGSGDLALAYSVSGSVFPSLRYTGRLAGDPAGALTLPEVHIVDGTGSQIDDGNPATNDGGRWGDYFSLSVDETDDCTFWFTGQYYANTGSFDFKTRIAAFKFAQCVSPTNGTVSGVVKNAGTLATLPGAVVRTTNGFFRTTNGSGAYSMVMAPGTYDFSAFAAPCLSQTQAGVSVASGAQTLDFFLVPGTIPITAPVSIPVGAAGQLAFVAPGAYAWTISDRAGTDLTGLITAGQGTNQITFDAAAPGTTLYLRVVDTGTSVGCTVSVRRVQVDFLDVPPPHIFHGHVVNLAGNGVTAGCGGGNYCPDTPVTREQMAAFLLIARSLMPGAPALILPSCTPPGPFLDVPCDSPFAPFIQLLVELGVTAGCGGGNYCPTVPVSREQMAPFLLLARGGVTLDPCTSDPFTDVPCTSQFAPFIKELVDLGVTAGCGGGRYCPTNPVTRGQMAVFLVNTFGLVFP